MQPQAACSSLASSSSSRPSFFRPSAACSSRSSSSQGAFSLPSACHSSIVAASPSIHPQRLINNNSLISRTSSSRPMPVLHATPAAVAVSSSSPPSPLADSDMQISQAASSALQYALKFSIVSETYEAHSWMILLGLLKQEDCRAAQILKSMGLDDLYAAWHEVLWALNVSNGLEPRAYTPDVVFADRALRIVHGAMNFATWGGRDKVQSEDLLLALAAGHVLTGVFPDLGLTFEAVRKAAAKHGCRYELPDDDEQKVAALKEEENFL